MKKVALITGASSGIGRSIALKLSEEGYFIILVARRKRKLNKILGEIKNRGIALPLDITREKDVRLLGTRVSKITPRVNVLINSAGIVHLSPLSDFPTAKFKETMDINVLGTFLVTREILRLMKKGDVVINIGSIASREVFLNWGAYCASKFALLGMTKTWREEIRNKGVRMCIIMPGSVDTPLWDNIEISGHFRKKLLTPDDVARAILYVVKNSEKASIEEIVIMPEKGII